MCISLPEKYLSPVLAKRYGAHALAFTRTRLSWPGTRRDLSFLGRVVESLFYFRECVSRVLVRRYRVMLWHLRAQDCPGWELEKCHVSIPEDKVPLVWGQRYKYSYICLYKRTHIHS